MPFFGDKQKTLNRKLLNAVKNNNLGEVKRLVNMGANIETRMGWNNYHATSLTWAAMMGHFEVVNYLVEKGANINARDDVGRTPLKLAESWSKERIVKQPQQEKRLNPDTADEVIFQQPLGDRILQENFNFVTLERISLIRKSAQGDVEAVTRQNFSEVADVSALRKAFDEHVRRGGKTEESRVFPNTLFKDRPPGQG